MYKILIIMIDNTIDQNSIAKNDLMNKLLSKLIVDTLISYFIGSMQLHF